MGERSGALTHYTVVDLTTSRAELAGRVLADLGALVIKAEPPGGCEARALPPFRDGSNSSAEGSLYWAYAGLGKRSVVLDLDQPADRDALLGVIDDADVLIESFDPGVMAAMGLDYATLRLHNPGLVYASVTPFGQTGPKARTPATDLTLEAAGGLVGLQGDGDRPPLAMAMPQASFHAGVQAAADIQIALFERNRSGAGQHLDVSMQAAVVWTLMNATGYPTNTGTNPPGTSEFRGQPRPTLVAGMRAQRTMACRDGFAVIGTHLPGVGERTLDGCMRWLEEEQCAPAHLIGRSWLGYLSELSTGAMPVESFNAAYDALGAWVSTKTKRALLDGALARKLLIAPIYDISDLRVDPHLTARGFWQRVGEDIQPGAFAQLSATPIRPDRPAPRLGADQTLVNARDKKIPRGAANDSTAQAFAGLKVADFAWVGVGPIISKALADHGATVIHIESAVRTDVLRALPPFKDATPGINRSQFFANFNTSKVGRKLELTDPNDLAEARRLAAWADVVVESFSPGTMARYGLDYATLSADRNDLVMLSTCMRGQSGPERQYTGFGNQGAALAGLISLVGWPDRPPTGPWGAYTDFIAPRYGVAALAAALLHRQTTGAGQYIDLSQIEAGIQFQGPLVLDHTVNGAVARAAGQVSRFACPHGIYRTRGEERYVAISVATAAQWLALTKLLPLDLPVDELRTLTQRAAHRESIEAALAHWCAAGDAFDIAKRLQSAGVPSHAVLRPSDLYDDAQLIHRGFFVTLDHPVMGPTPCDGHVTQFSRTPARLSCPAPIL